MTLNPFLNYCKYYKELESRSVESLCLELVGKRFLKHTLEISQRVGIKPFLTFGTLLGYRREQGFIPHDTDIDLGLLENDWQHIHRLETEMAKEGYPLKTHNKYIVSFYHPISPSLHIDFFLFYNKDDRMIISCVQGGQIYHYHYSPEIFAHFKETTFLDIPVVVPVEVDAFLQQSYGNWKVENKAFDYTDAHSCPNLHIEKLPPAGESLVK